MFVTASEQIRRRSKIQRDDETTSAKTDPRVISCPHCGRSVRTDMFGTARAHLIPDPRMRPRVRQVRDTCRPHADRTAAPFVQHHVVPIDGAAHVAIVMRYLRSMRSVITTRQPAGRSVKDESEMHLDPDNGTVLPVGGDAMMDRMALASLAMEHDARATAENDRAIARIKAMKRL